ncbi:MAG: hypothetical protein WD342_13270 [Verrucomicrobiales bacterium]
MYFDASSLSWARRLLVLSAVVSLSACSTAKKRSGDSEAGLTGVLPFLESKEEEEKTFEKLKAIADAPSSSLAGSSSEASASVAPNNPAETPPTDPTEAWSRDGVDARRVSIGDIFSDNVGPILNKKVALTDKLSAEDRRRLLDRISTVTKVRVPVTLSSAELLALKPEADPDLPFPTRSVALDFTTTTRSADVDELEKLFERLAGDEAPESPGETQKKLASVKERLAAGDRLFAVVGLTRSDKLFATYPGAPLGSRDAEPIRNAVSSFYPHLDSLEATKSGEAVEITRSPGIYWEFEAREIKLDKGRIVIGDETLASL